MNPLKEQYSASSTCQAIYFDAPVGFGAQR